MWNNKNLEKLSHAKYWDQRYIREKESGKADIEFSRPIDSDSESNPDSEVKPLEAGNANEAGKVAGDEKELGTYEWFRSIEQIMPLLNDNMPPPPPLLTVGNDETGSGILILHLGCGNSILPADLYALGYLNQLCVDFSTIVIPAMAAKYVALKGVEWKVMDIRCMELESGSVDIAIDKSTLDAMMYGSLWDPPVEVRKNVGAYVDEVARVLRSGGKWIYITYRQPHFMKPLLLREGIWDIETTVLGGEGDAFEYYGFVMVKI